MCHHYDVSLTEWICQCRYGIIVLLADGTRPTDANQLLVLVAVLLTQYSFPLLVILYVPSFSSCSAHPIALRKSTTPEMILLSLSKSVAILSMSAALVLLQWLYNTNSRERASFCFIQNLRLIRSVRLTRRLTLLARE